MSDTSVPSPSEGIILRDQDQGIYHEDVCRHITAFFRAVQDGRREQ